LVPKPEGSKRALQSWRGQNGLIDPRQMAVAIDHDLASGAGVVLGRRSNAPPVPALGAGRATVTGDQHITTLAGPGILPRGHLARVSVGIIHRLRIFAVAVADGADQRVRAGRIATTTRL